MTTLRLNIISSVLIGIFYFLATTCFNVDSIFWQQFAYKVALQIEKKGRYWYILSPVTIRHYVPQVHELSSTTIYAGAKIHTQERFQVKEMNRIYLQIFEKLIKEPFLMMLFRRDLLHLAFSKVWKMTKFWLQKKLSLIA